MDTFVLRHEVRKKEEEQIANVFIGAYFFCATSSLLITNSVLTYMC